MNKAIRSCLTEAPKPKAYSYVRFSTPEQSKGDSFRRQTEAAIAYCQKHQLELDTSVTFHDLGVSAFKGKNAETGALRGFLQAVEDGHIAEGSYLLVESLDRISRASVVQAQTLFMSIICAGITLVTLGDGRVYSEDSLNANPTEFLISLIVMMRGNDESATKARRVKAAWANKRKQVLESGKLFTKLVPAWVRVTANGVLEAIPERAAIVRRVYDLYLTGMGRQSIAKLLNAEGVPPWGLGSRRAASHWHVAYVTKLLDSPAVVGTLITRTVETERGREVIKEAQRVEGYYPRVVDDETYARVRALRDTAGSVKNKGSNKPRSLLAGLCVCPKCGGTMTRVAKGARSRPSFVCTKAKLGAGCQYRSVPQEHVEAALSAGNVDLVTALMSEGNESLATEVNALERDVLALEGEMENVADAIAKGGHSPLLARRMRDLEGSLEAVQQDLRNKRVHLFTHTHAMRRSRIEELGDLLEGEDVPQINLALRELLHSVVVNYETGYLECITKAGTKVEVMYRWLDGDAPVQAS